MDASFSQRVCLVTLVWPNVDRMEWMCAPFLNFQAFLNLHYSLVLEGNPSWIAYGSAGSKINCTDSESESCTLLVNLFPPDVFA